MKKENALQLAEKINRQMLDIVVETLKKELDVEVGTPQAIVTENSYGCYVYIGFFRENTKSLITGNKLLQHMFVDGELKLRCYQLEGEVVVAVDIDYKHPRGMNGLELIEIHIIEDTMKVVVK